MRRVVPIAVVLAVAGTAAVLWWSAQGPEVGDPPTLADPDEVDPLVAELVGLRVDAARRAPRSAEARAELARALHANNLLAPADVAYGQALALDPDDPRLWYARARVRAAHGDLDAAVADARRALALDDGYAPAHARLGFWLLTLGRADEAEAAFARSVELAPDAPAGAVGLARVAMQRRDWPRAAARLETLVARHPDLPYLRHLLGTACRHLGRDDEARRLLADADGRVPHWADPWSDEVARLATGFETILSRGQAILGAGHPDRALETLRPLLETYPDHPALLNTIASVHLAAGRTGEAIDVLEASLAADPDQHVTHQNLSVAYERTGEPTRALRHAEQAAALHPAFGPAHVQRGRMLIRLDRVPEAAAPLQAALDAGVDDPDVVRMLGEVLAVLERWDEAAAAYRRLLERRPDDPVTLLRLARAEGEGGRLDEAWALLRRARELDPPDDLVRSTIVRLRELETGSDPAGI
ncbi:MAG: tetratricopeptide repeat protein [Planctomycetota bacterium]|jgi:tetratricopeptide (TPR) repeat protein